MPLTASKTAAWTMAAGRVVFTPEVPAISVARNSISFQFRTSSAHAGVTRDTAMTREARTMVRLFFMAPPCGNQFEDGNEEGNWFWRDDLRRDPTAAKCAGRWRCTEIVQYEQALRTRTDRGEIDANRGDPHEAEVHALHHVTFVM